MDVTYHKFGLALAACLAMGMITSPLAAAQSLEQRIASCNQTEGPADIRISACTALIQSGRFDDHNLAIIYSRRAGALSDQNDTSHAMADYNEAIRLNPQDASVYYSRGILYTALGDYTRAIADDDQAAILEPTNAEFQNGRWWDRVMAGREWGTARTACDAALSMVPGRPSFLDTRGMLNLKQGRFQEAWNDYDAGVRGDATYASVRYGRGIAALRLGRTAEGQADLDAAVRMDAAIAATFAGYGVSP